MLFRSCRAFSNLNLYLMNIHAHVKWLATRTICKILHGCLLLLFSSMLQSQTLFGGFMLGGMNYQGELQDKYFTFKGINAAVGISTLFALNDRFSFSAELMRGSLKGSDARPDSRNRTRNLQFATAIYELSAAGRINVFTDQEIPFTPYLVGGGSVFHIDPFTLDEKGGKVYLFPLSTEGQGLAEYPDRPFNNRINIAMLGGAGIEFRVTKKLRVDFEIAIRKSFTDYIDDVSTTYPDPNLLYPAFGALSVQYSYRGDEVSGGNPTFQTGAQRGNPATADWFHMVFVRLRYPIFDRAVDVGYPRYFFRKNRWPYSNY